ncbi:unnamed protein product [Linum tenue]|uniref:Uncharacterized protein n=1 Tax=Linum tenue TaxID=586396 RepID=A0AAV0IQM6_9ROSI|nr:unnamed protein product [Linum tenue]
MGVATRADSKGVCGCLTLLQTWIYEYFPLFRRASCRSLRMHPVLPCGFFLFARWG